VKPKSRFKAQTIGARLWIGLNHLVVPPLQKDRFVVEAFFERHLVGQIPNEQQDSGLGMGDGRRTQLRSW
jgi:hypothetical protein